MVGCTADIERVLAGPHTNERVEMKKSKGRLTQMTRVTALIPTGQVANFVYSREGGDSSILYTLDHSARGRGS